MPDMQRRPQAWHCAFGDGSEGCFGYSGGFGTPPGGDFWVGTRTQAPRGRVYQSCCLPPGRPRLRCPQPWRELAISGRGAKLLMARSAASDPAAPGGQAARAAGSPTIAHGERQRALLAVHPAPHDTPGTAQQPGMEQPDVRGVVEDSGPQQRDRCGYCKGASGSSVSHGGYWSGCRDPPGGSRAGADPSGVDAGMLVEEMSVYCYQGEAPRMRQPSSPLAYEHRPVLPRSWRPADRACPRGPQTSSTWAGGAPAATCTRRAAGGPLSPSSRQRWHRSCALHHLAILAAYSDCRRGMARHASPHHTPARCSPPWTRHAALSTPSARTCCSSRPARSSSRCCGGGKSS